MKMYINTVTRLIVTLIVVVFGVRDMSGVVGVMSGMFVAGFSRSVLM